MTEVVEMNVSKYYNRISLQTFHSQPNNGFLCTVILVLTHVYKVLVPSRICFQTEGPMARMKHFQNSPKQIVYTYLRWTFIYCQVIYHPIFSLHESRILHNDARHSTYHHFPVHVLTNERQMEKKLM